MNIIQTYKIYREIPKADSVAVIHPVDYTTRYQISTPRYDITITKEDIPFDEEGEYALSATNKKTGKKIYINGLTAEFLLSRIMSKTQKVR